MKLDDDLITVSEAAKMLNYSASQIRRFIKAGVIDAVRVDGGRKYLINKKSLNERM